MIAIAILFSGMVAAAQTTPAIVQKSTGWCSPNIANVSGPVTVNCIGVDPRALSTLNQELRRKDLQREEAIREADQWAARYHELEARLSQNPDQSGRSEQALEYLRAGDLDQAGKILDQILASDDPQTNRIANDHYNKALVDLLEFRVDDALPELKKAYLLAQANEYSVGMVAYGHEYAGNLVQSAQTDAAELVFTAILPPARRLAQANPPFYRPLLAEILTDQGANYMITQQWDLAEKATREAVAILQPLAKADPNSYEFTLFEAMQNLAETLRGESRFADCETAFKDLIAAIHAQPDPSAFDGVEAMAWFNLGNLYLDAGQKEKSEAAYKEALRLRRQYAATHPGFELAVALALRGLANAHVAMQDFEDAEGELKEAVGLLRTAALRSPHFINPYLATALTALGELYLQTQKMPAAESPLNEALAILGPLQSENLLAYQTLTAPIQSDLGDVYANAQRFDLAEKAYAEALNDYRQIVATNMSYRAALANTLTHSALMHGNQGNLPQAQSEISEAVGIDRELYAANPSGTADSLSRSLLVNARIGILAHQPAPAICALLNEVYAVAVSPVLRETAADAAHGKCAPPALPAH